MSFISNAGHFTLGEGVYTNIHGNLIHNAFYGRKHHREEIEDAPGLLALGEPPRKCRRREEEDGIKEIRNKHLKLTLEIGSGPGYFLHVGEAKGRAVMVKVFNPGLTAREQFELTVSLSKRLLHPNVLRIEGISSPASVNHFIAYENAHWRTADGPLAAALKDDLTRSVTLGFKMIAGLSSGMNHLDVQGIFPASLGVENFDVFLDVNDRFLISINPPTSANADDSKDSPQRDNTTSSWNVFNALCQKVLRSANRVLHDEDIERKPMVLALSRPSVSQRALAPSTLPAAQSPEPVSSESDPVEVSSVAPRREYVWRTIDGAQQSLDAVARRVTWDLEMKLSSVSKLTWTDTDGGSAHRCAGYVREEITLATTAIDSAVVSYDAPSPLEVCSVCHEVVGSDEVFRCICGDLNPGSRPTIKCPTCRSWSHSDCVGNPKELACAFCMPTGAHHTANRDESPLIEPSAPEDSRDIVDRSFSGLFPALQRVEPQAAHVPPANPVVPTPSPAASPDSIPTFVFGLPSPPPYSPQGAERLPLFYTPPSGPSIDLYNRETSGHDISDLLGWVHRDMSTIEFRDGYPRPEDISHHLRVPSFNFGQPPSYSDATSERPVFMMHADELQGSAVDNAFSHDAYSPWMPEDSLAAPAMYRHPNASSGVRSHSNTSSSSSFGGSSISNLDLPRGHSSADLGVPVAFWDAALSFGA
ncbi:hypothetical protein B0H19DRAFT_1375969 [Mycena capillaripes]|nr:hypothetical protein B0H19DRAFT_1375969 [Mycena capillaripes]